MRDANEKTFAVRSAGALAIQPHLLRERLLPFQDLQRSFWVAYAEHKQASLRGRARGEVRIVDVDFGPRQARGDAGK